MSPTAKKATKPATVVTPHRDEDGFWVEEDGLVEMRLELTFVEDAVVRVTPEVAKRIMDGEFDNQDGRHSRRRRGESHQQHSHRARVGVREPPHPPDKTAGIVDGDGGDEGDDEGDDDDDDLI